MRWNIYSTIFALAKSPGHVDTLSNKFASAGIRHGVCAVYRLRDRLRVIIIRFAVARGVLYVNVRIELGRCIGQVDSVR